MRERTLRIWRQMPPTATADISRDGDALIGEAITHELEPLLSAYRAGSRR